MDQVEGKWIDLEGRAAVVIEVALVLAPVLRCSQQSGEKCPSCGLVRP